MMRGIREVQVFSAGEGHERAWRGDEWGELDHGAVSKGPLGMAPERGGLVGVSHVAPENGSERSSSVPRFTFGRTLEIYRGSRLQRGVLGRRESMVAGKRGQGPELSPLP